MQLLQLTIRFESGLGLGLSHKRLRAHWNKKLTQEFPLAPRDLVRNGKVNAQQYGDESSRLGKLGADQVQGELEDLSFSKVDLIHKRLRILGIGLRRDWGFIPLANRLGLNVIAHDVSDYACQAAEDFLAGIQTEPGVDNRVENSEIGEMLESEIDFPDPVFTQLVYAGQFVQVLPRKRMRMLMRVLGKFLQAQGRRVVLIHPFPEDNPGVEWGDTVAYTLNELLKPAQEGLGGKAEVLRLKKGGFYHHVYSAFTLKAK